MSCNLFNSCQSAIRRVNISGNVDNPEGTMDALMQIAVCGSVRMLYWVKELDDHI